MESHKYAQLFPLASEGELAEMAADIKQRGLLHPIITVNGQILDGRNRFRACELAGVTPVFREYEGVDPLADVISWNLHRRQLSTSQRAALAVELKPMFEAEAKEREALNNASRANLPYSQKGRSRDKAAEAVNVSGRIVQDAETILKDDPEEFEKIKSGKSTVNAAKRNVERKRRKKQEQEEEEPKDRVATRGNSKAIQHAAEAINILRKIKETDPARREAFRMVRKWVTDNE